MVTKYALRLAPLTFVRLGALRKGEWTEFGLETAEWRIPAAIERQLAHAERDEVRAAYNHAEHLPERRRMMQARADYLDGLRAGAEVTAIKKAAT